MEQKRRLLLKGHLGPSVIAILLVALSSSACTKQQSATPGKTPPVPLAVDWNASSSALSPGDQSLIRSALATQSDIRSILPTGTHPDIVQADINGSAGVLYASERLDSDGSIIPTEGLVLLVRRSSAGSWAVVPPQDAGFCDIVKNLPPGVIDQPSTSISAGC
jgi:hypothetical protein